MSQTDSTKTSGQKVKKQLISPLKEALSQLKKSYKFFIPNEQDVILVHVDLQCHIELLEATSRALKLVPKPNPVDYNPNNYDIYVAKKNGHPKMDFPSYQTNLRLEETGNFVFSLVHVTYQEKNVRKSIRKSTYDLSHYQSPTKPSKSKEINLNILKPETNWLLRFLGCA
ncbi:unnamed protein product (macronuclear) [Paramecium tetraurelia]|uniref:Uncharacterized protein n=1 Tax=Paramecium tetraurelia TaxID=5888 RepID=A0BNV2_PARTE|nr:uncharacterized protein GSPATT00030858001 [Paramecium tetraurelia]CAK60219.1 unnamed protein product [Paramecium tetraurelia]|eukprot:XP_001427617.1 hypothetical protein (macronuclear) [Paramecium tetraurelia strain d4-2]